MLDFSKRFSIGINIDDSWRYSGFRVLESFITPHLLSIEPPVGSVIDKIDELRLKKHGHTEHKTGSCILCNRAILSLAENPVDAEIDFVRCWFP